LQGATYSVNFGDHFIYNGNTYKATSSTPTCVRVAYYNYPSITAYGGKFRLNDAFYTCSAYGSDFVAIVMFDAVIDNAYTCDVGPNAVCYNNTCTDDIIFDDKNYEKLDINDSELCTTNPDGSDSVNIWRTKQDCSSSTGACYLQKTCHPLVSAYQSSTFLQNECTLSNLSNLYDTNTPNSGKYVSNVIFNCDNICYFELTNTITPPVDNNVTTDTNITNNLDTNSTNGTDGQDGVDGTNGQDGVDGTNGTNGIDGIDGTNGTNGTDGTDGIDAPSGEYTNILGSINSGISILHDDLQSLMSDINTTGDFDDSRIVKANNNTTKAINDIKNIHEGQADNDTAFFDNFQVFADDLQSSFDDLENNVNDLMATIDGNYVPNFQSYNSCILKFKVYDTVKPFDICQFSSTLRPYIVFILTIYFLLLLIRLHIFFLMKLFRSTD
jgi:hypothetical protein